MANLQANSKNIKMPKWGMPGAVAIAHLPNNQLSHAAVLRANLCTRTDRALTPTGLDLAVQ